MLDLRPSALAADPAERRARIRGRAGRTPDEPFAWIVEPPKPRPDAAPVVVVHGVNRDAEGMARRLAARAAATGRIVVAPLFAEPRFAGYQRVLGRTRADLALIGLLDALADEGVLPRGRIDLAGYSGGAQFAHRFAWLYPHRVGRLVAAAAGWWTFPDAAPFPYGLGRPAAGTVDAPRWLRANLVDFLDRDITVAIGGADCAPDANTRGGPAIDAQQGADRLTRARRWTRAMRGAAERLGLEPRIALAVLLEAPHDFQACAAAGLDRLILPGAARAGLASLPTL